MSTAGMGGKGPVRRIGVSIGDANGIGPEIAVKAALSLREAPVRIVLVGDAFVLRDELGRLANRFGDADAALVPFEAERAPVVGGIEFVDVAALPPLARMPGQVSAQAGAATIAYARAAIDLARQGIVDAVVGCPHSETAIHRAGIAFSGYPGLVAECTGARADQVFLMLVSPELKIGHVTLHERLQHAISRITPHLVVDAARAVVDAVRALGIERPRLGVFGINPHAGEGGLFGDDDERVTLPAVATLRALGMDVDGPAGADMLLSQRKHDVYLAMYHDQGHIPIKLLSPLQASAMSIGAGVLFSSVGHGSAFDIAGKGVADPAATIRTIRLLAGIEADS